MIDDPRFQFAIAAALGIALALTARLLHRRLQAPRTTSGAGECPLQTAPGDGNAGGTLRGSTYVLLEGDFLDV